MSSLEKVARTAFACPSVLFRERAYGSVERQAFIRDIVGLANALVDGPRYLILGARDCEPEERVFAGVTDKEVEAARERYQAEILRYIEPNLTIDVQPLQLDGVTLVILALNTCNEPPYLLKENLSNSMREGSGWILRTKEASRLRRADLQALFEKTLLGPSNQPAIEVGFVAGGLVEELSLDVLDLLELPSHVAGEKIRKLIEAKQASRDLAGKTTTRLERLVFAREFGGNKPFERVSQTALSRRVDSAEEEYSEADDYYRHEIRTHKINIGLANVSDVDLRGALLTVDIPRVEGLGVSEYIRVAPGADAEPPVGYPVVDLEERRIRIHAKVAVAPRHETVGAFAQPLRLSLRAPAAGQTLPVDYRLHAENLREPMLGTLRLRVSAS